MSSPLRPRVSRQLCLMSHCWSFRAFITMYELPIHAWESDKTPVLALHYSADWMPCAGTTFYKATVHIRAQLLTDLHWCLECVWNSTKCNCTSNQKDMQSIICRTPQPSPMGDIAASICTTVREFVMRPNCCTDELVRTIAYYLPKLQINCDESKLSCRWVHGNWKVLPISQSERVRSVTARERLRRT